MANYQIFRDKLLRLKAELKQRLVKTQEHITRSEGPLAADFAEQATEKQNDDVIYGLDDSAKREIAQINKALERIDNNEYGICAMCGERIPVERLQVLPYTDLCKDCAELAAIGKQP